jgi:hypothetical protein
MRNPTVTIRPACFAALLLLGACAAPMGGPPMQSVTLPPSAQQPGAQDPVTGAILGAAFTFGQPASVASNPSGAAAALGQVRFLSVELAGPRWIGMDPTVLPAMGRAWEEIRAAYNFREVAPQVAVDALFNTSALLRDGDRAGATRALAPLAAAGAEAATLDRLAPLPPLPLTARATAAASSGFTQMQNDEFRRRR